MTQKHPFLFREAKHCCNQHSKKRKSLQAHPYKMVVNYHKEQISNKTEKFKFKPSISIAAISANIKLLRRGTRQKVCVKFVPFSCLSTVMYLFMLFYLETVKYVFFFAHLICSIIAKLGIIGKINCSS